jgi:hypothetical protein
MLPELHSCLSPCILVQQMHAKRQLTIVSGGQSGADRAALDWAIAHGVPYSGWCPQGRRAEDGRIDECYVLRETSSPGYGHRTEANVLNSDGSVIFSISEELTGGSWLTADLARKHGKPLLHLAAKRRNEDHARMLYAFVEEHAIEVLNVAGPRASKEPRVGAFVRRVLNAAFGQCASATPPAARQPRSRL